MDAESIEVLNGLVVRWRKRATAWQEQNTEHLDQDKLDADIAMLVRHVEGLRCITNTLHELETIRTSLVVMRHHQQQIKPIVTSGDPELQAIEDEMRALHCHHEDFWVKYMMVRGDYRMPVLPLPHGFKCHKQYKFELDLLNTRLANALAQAEQQRIHLHDNNGPEEVKAMSELNQHLNTYQSLQASRYHLLMHVEPIDAAAFHSKCGALIERRMKYLEGKRLEQIQALSAAHAVRAE